MPRERRVGFLMLVGLQNQISRRQQDFLHVGILPDFLARRGDDEFVEIAWMLELSAFIGAWNLAVRVLGCTHVSSLHRPA